MKYLNQPSNINREPKFQVSSSVNKTENAFKRDLNSFNLKVPSIQTFSPPHTNPFTGRRLASSPNDNFVSPLDKYLSTPSPFRFKTEPNDSIELGNVGRSSTMQMHPDVSFYSGAWLFDLSEAPRWLQEQLQPSRTTNTSSFMKPTITLKARDKSSRPFPSSTFFTSQLNGLNTTNPKNKGKQSNMGSYPKSAMEWNQAMWKISFNSIGNR